MGSRFEMLCGDEGTVIIQKQEHVTAVVGSLERERHGCYMSFFFSSYSVWAPNTCNIAPDFRVASPSTVKSLEVPSKPCLEV